MQVKSWNTESTEDTEKSKKAFLFTGALRAPALDPLCLALQNSGRKHREKQKSFAFVFLCVPAFCFF
jgi:hypothetical protein